MRDGISQISKNQNRKVKERFTAVRLERSVVVFEGIVDIKLSLIVFI